MVVTSISERCFHLASAVPLRSPHHTALGCSHFPSPRRSARGSARHGRAVCQSGCRRAGRWGKSSMPYAGSNARRTKGALLLRPKVLHPHPPVQPRAAAAGGGPGGTAAVPLVCGRATARDPRSGGTVPVPCVRGRAAALGPGSSATAAVPLVRGRAAA